MNGRKQERRLVEIGEFTDEFIEVKSGIKEGDRVCLRAPDSPEKGKDEKGSTEQGKDKSKPAAPTPQSSKPGSLG